MEAMDNLREAKIPLASNTQINRVNYKEIPELFELLAAKKIHGWQFQLTTAMGRGGDEPDVLLEPWRLVEVMPMIARLKKRADEAGVRFWPGNNIGYFGPYEHLIRAGFPGGYRGSCGAGKSVLGIEANGDIKGCPSLPTKDYVGGNIRDHSLEEIWERSAPLRFTRDFTVETSLHGFCRDCYYADDCRAGCNWTTHVLFGKTGDNPYCHHRVLELLEKGERESLRKVEEAEGLPFDYGRYEIVREAWPEEQLAWARSLAKEEIA
jgi:radical SAM protein with 4Fe4S-binding SPASM domain